MKKRAVIVIVALAALSMAAVGFSVAGGSAGQQVATPASQQQTGQCEHQPGSLACREAHANGQCDHGPGPCDPAKCDPAKCDPDKCAGQNRPCDPAACAAHRESSVKSGCSGHARGGHPGCPGHGTNEGE